MLPALMQATPLLISSILRYAESAHGGRDLVSRIVGEPPIRIDFDQFARRCRQLASALSAAGIGEGDRVSSLAWNTHRHLELFYGVTGIGAVLHTANPRLYDEQIIFTINQAESGILFFDRNMVEIVKRIQPHLETVTCFILLADAEHEPTASLSPIIYEQFLLTGGDIFEWPQLDENAAAFLCYTSGTTGNPKGVLYSNRSVVLHAMASAMSSCFGLTAFDVVMPCSSLYHATAWGLPFAAMMCGAKIVLPADRMDPADLHELIECEGVTFTGGVPTIWNRYLTWLADEERSPSDLKRVVIAGSAVPRAMAETFNERYNIDVLQFWGMTETSPLGVVSTPTPALAALGEAACKEVLRDRQGRLQFGIELKIVAANGADLPHDGVAFGTLKVRGPWTIRRYYRDEQDCVDADGWFDTGDIATIDPLGFMKLVDRTKDVIKSGGEWISSVDLENVTIGCPGVRLAAVVGLAHPKWDERPLMVVELHEGAATSHTDIIDYISPKVAKWWLPDDIVFHEVPLTATGKIDKKQLRDRYEHHFTRARQNLES